MIDVIKTKIRGTKIYNLYNNKYVIGINTQICLSNILPNQKVIFSYTGYNNVITIYGQKPLQFFVLFKRFDSNNILL